MQTDCDKAKERYEELLLLKERFDGVYEKAIQTGDLAEARALKKDIVSKKETLLGILDPLAEVLRSMEAPSLREQYETQKNSFEELGILTILSTGEQGIKGGEGKEYPFPSYTEVSQMARENKEMLKHKVEQGFVRLQMTPFALSIPKLREHYGKEILKRHNAGGLKATNGDTLEVNENEPVWMWNGYETEEMVYFPKEFSPNHGGISKQDAINKEGGWRVIFTEDLPDIPREGNGEAIGGRMQIEAGKTPNDYLDSLPKDEQGLTMEDWLSYAVLRLKEKGTVIDDWQGNGSVSYQLAAYFPVSGYVPYGFWDRDDRQAFVVRAVPALSGAGDGCRASVRMKKS